MLRNVAAALLVLGVGQSAFAEEMRQVNTGEVNYFIGIDFAKVDHTIGFEDYSDEYDASATAMGLTAGYWFDEHVAIEVGYVDFGDDDLFTDYYGPGDIDYHRVEGKAYTIAGVLSTPTWQKPWRWYGELGLHKTDYTWEVSGLYSGTPYRGKVVDASEVDIWGGFGIAYSVGSNLEIKLAVDWFVLKPKVEFDSSTTTDIQLNRYALGVNYQF